MGSYKNNKDGTGTVISTNIQVVDAPMEEFLSRGEFNAVTPNDVGVQNKLVAENEVTKAVSTMPTASSSLVGTIVQYVGTTTANYTNGYFYKCVSDGAITPTYSWVEVISGGGGGSGDMLTSVYDSDGTVAQAGGIPEYVEGEIEGIDSQISEISELVNIHEERRNIFDYTDVTDNKYRASTLGSSINDSVDKANGWYSNQIWEVKKGDVIYQSTRWFPLLIYNSDGILVEYRTNGDTGGIYTITNDNAKYLTIQASAHTNEYLYKLMLSINEPLPAEYVPYTDVRTVSQFDTVEDKIPTDGKAILNKGFVILSFDAFNSVDDTRFDIVNEYGFKASVACAYSYGYDWSDVYTKISKQGWDCHLYSGNNWPSAESYYVDNPSAEIQAVWDAYVKEEVDYALSQGVTNPTAWGCRQGKSCDGLENACKKYGIKMVRGGTKATKFTEKFSYATTSPTSLNASTTQNCIAAFTAAANVGYGVLFTTHGIYETTEEADTHYGMTEATLRQFLSALKALVDEGKLEVLTFREVYQKYYQNDALHNNYDRLAYRAFGTNLPSGGTTGQVLVKSSNADYDTEWRDADGIPSNAKTEEQRLLSDLGAYWNINNPIVIGFSTDQHLDNNNAKVEKNIVPNLKTMADLTKHFPFNIVVLGGDASATSTSLSAKQQNVETITECLDGAYCPVFHLIGNHDATQDIPSMTASAAFSAHRTMPIKQKYAVVTDESTNCYYDDPTTNIRFIMLCSETFSAYSNTNSRTFLANALETLPNDYQAIIFSHRPLGNLTDNPSTRVDDWNNPLGWGDTVNPYKSKIIACICGHVHADKSEVKDGILYLSTTCAGWYELNDGSQRGIYDGTPQSTAYDVFVIDRDTHTIHCVRYGNGQNRDISYPSGYTNVLSQAIDTDGEIYNDIGYKLGYRLNSQGTETSWGATTGVTGFIPVEIGDVVRLKNISLIGVNGETNSTDYITFYDSNFSMIRSSYSNSVLYTDETAHPETYINPILDANNKIIQFTIPQFEQGVGENVVYMRLSTVPFAETAIITLNEEM